jgi:hypothetical protein
VDSGNQWFSHMCAGANPPLRTKSPLMAFAAANRHDAFISYSAYSGKPGPPPLNNNGTWWCHYTVHRPDFTKHRIRVSLQTSSRRIARAKRDRRFAEFTKGARHEV